MLSAADPLPATDDDDTVVALTYDGGKVARAFLRGVSQIFFQETAVSGALIIVGMAFCSPIAAAAVYLGSVASTSTAMAMGVPPELIFNGVSGYNGALCGIAIGGMFFVLQGRAVYAFAIAACVVCAILSAAVGQSLAPVGLPALTFPFVLTCWLFCLAGQSATKGLFAVELGAMSLPEDHRKRYTLILSLTSKFRDIGAVSDVMSVGSPEDLDRLERMLAPVLLCFHAQRGHAAQLRGMLRLGCNLRSMADYDGRTSLHLAAAEGDVALCRMLCREGAEIGAKDRFGESALADAVRARSDACISLLLNEAANADAAAEKKCEEETELVAVTTTTMEEGGNSGTSDGDDEGRWRPRAVEILLFIAAGDDAQALRMIRAGGERACVGLCDYDSRSPLHLAASLGNSPLCAELVRLGADPGAVDFAGNSACDDARREGHGNALEAISAATAAAAAAAEEGGDDDDDGKHQFGIDAADNTDGCNGNGNDNDDDDDDDNDDDAAQRCLLSVVLNDAAKRGDVARIAAIAARMAPTPLGAARDYDQRTPLHLAASEGHLAATRVLLHHGAGVNALDRWGETALLGAIVNRHEEVVACLVEAGAGIGLPAMALATRLCDAVKSGDAVALKLFARGGATFREVDYDGRGPLHVAGGLGSEEMFGLLMRGGADPEAKDRWGSVPALKRR